MKVGDAFPSSYLKAEDLGQSRAVVTIDRVEVEELGQGQDKERKPVVYFKGKDKGLALNRTNAQSIVEITGTDETDDWPGHRIVLFATKTDFQGKRVPCIRIDSPPKGAVGSRPAPPPPPPPEEEFQASDDDVPF